MGEGSGLDVVVVGDLDLALLSPFILRSSVRGNRTFKLPPGTTSEPGHCVKSLGDPRDGKDVLPVPFLRSGGVLSSQGVGQDHLSEPLCEIGAVVRVRHLELSAQIVAEAARKHRHPNPETSVSQTIEFLPLA